jgi:hypothetical protein
MSNLAINKQLFIKLRIIFQIREDITNKRFILFHKIPNKNIKLAKKKQKN